MARCCGPAWPPAPPSALGAGIVALYRAEDDVVAFQLLTIEERLSAGLADVPLVAGPFLDL